MRGGEDLSSRRRRSSSRGSITASLSIQPAVLGSSNVGASRPSATGSSTAHASTTAAELRCSNAEPPRGPAVQSTQPPPADVSASTAVQSSENPAADESSDSSFAEHGSNGAAYCGPDAPSRHVPVAWQPGIDLLEGMQEGTARDSPTETRRLSDSAASGPRSYPLSPRSLAAVSPGPPAQPRDGGTAIAHQPAEGSPLAGAARASLPASAQVSVSVANTSAHAKLNGWALPPRAPHASAGRSADAQLGGHSKAAAGNTAVRPLEKQLSNVDGARQAAEPGE